MIELFRVGMIKPYTKVWEFGGSEPVSIEPCGVLNLSFYSCCLISVSTKCEWGFEEDIPALPSILSGAWPDDMASNQLMADVLSEYTGQCCAKLLLYMYT